MISSVDLFGWGGTDEDWLKTAVLDPETAREFDSLLTTRDLSADRSDILLFLYGRAYESDLADARWPDESAFWEALERSDPVGVIARVSGLGRPVRSRSRTRVDYARLAQCVLDARGATGIHPLRTLRHCWDPALFDYGPLTPEIRAVLAAARPRVDDDPDALAAAVGDISAELDRLRARTLERAPGVMARIALTYRARQRSDPLALTAALALATGQRRAPVVPLWREVARYASDPEEGFRSPLYRVPQGHPIALLDGEDLGPNAHAFRAFYARSGHLSRRDVVGLVDSWTMRLWWSRASGVAAGVGARERPAAYATARRLGAIGLHRYARRAIKDAAGAVLLRDLIDQRDYRTLTEVWRRATGEEPGETNG